MFYNMIHNEHYIIINYNIYYNIMYRLTQKDYKLILKYYNINTDTLSKKDIQQQAESILAKKMCRCIKTIDRHASGSSASSANIISICKKSVLGNKNLKNYKFTCKKKQRFIPQKNTNIVLVKTKKKLKLYSQKTRRIKKM